MFTLFSVDDHIIEPRDVWTSRLPAKYRDVGPRVIEADGREYWVYEGRRNDTFGLNAVAGKPREEWALDPVRFTDMIPSCYDPKLRADELRGQGIFASVNFPTLPRFGGVLFTTFEDKALALLSVRAWNDFVLDEWCAAAPELFVPMIIVPLWDPALAATEIERCVAKGAKALCFVENPLPLGLPSFHHPDHWDPVWAACQAADIPVCMHIGSSGVAAVGSTILDPDTPAIVHIAAAFSQAAACSVSMMLSPVCRKFPDIKLVWSEGGIGWIPAAIERADRQYERHLWSHTTSDDLMPSDIARRNMWFCMIEEPIGLKYRYDFAVDRILWESDFPHADTPYPNTQENAKMVFQGVPDDEVAMITHGNAEALFHFPMTVPEHQVLGTA